MKLSHRGPRAKKVKGLYLVSNQHCCSPSERFKISAFSPPRASMALFVVVFIVSGCFGWVSHRALCLWIPGTGITGICELGIEFGFSATATGSLCLRAIPPSLESLIITSNSAKLVG